MPKSPLLPLNSLNTMPKVDVGFFLRTAVYMVTAMVIPLTPRTLLASEAPAITEVKYYSRGNSPGLWPYQNALLLLALEKTRRDYGDYVITYYAEMLSSSRAKFETERGRLINLHYSTGWEGEFLNEENIIKIRHPILKGLLGMRSLVIRKEDIAKFEKVNSVQDLKRFRAGQGKSWYDVSILQNQGIQVVPSTVFQNLAPMLVAKRFEFLPLSILEAQAAVDSFEHPSRKIAISDDLALFYPLPIHLCISKSAPDLAQRLDVGVARTVADGSLEQLFSAHFGFVEQQLRNKNIKTLLLENPHLSKADNQTLTANFIARFGDKLQIVPQHQ